MTSLDDTWFTTPGRGGGMGFRGEPPREVGGWTVHAQVGEGGFGRVYLAHKADRRGALKVLRPDWVTHANADAMRQSFESEAGILAQLSGSHTAELIDADVSGYTPWLVTRFVPGDTLAHQVMFENPVRGRAWWDLAFGLFSGLEEAHSKGIIHRDIKPSNVMRSADVSAIIIDFGIALMASSTDSMNRAGTALFQSPEQRRGEQVTPASDVYSAALTLLYVSTKPHSPQRDEFTKIDAPGVPFVDDVFDRHSVEADILRRALALDPSARPSAEKMVEMCGFWGARQVEEPARFSMAPPAAPSAPPPGVMSHGLPEQFGMELPTRRVRQVSWRQVEASISRLLAVHPGQAAHLEWFDDGIEVNVFGLHTPHVVVELRAPSHHGDAMLQQMLDRGWARPENPRDGSWLLVLPGGRKVAAHIVTEILGVVREVLGIDPSRPEST